MKTEQIAIEKIIPYEKNAKKHDKKQTQQVANSIERFGWVQPLVIDKDNNLIIGHCRLEAAKILGQKEVPTMQVENLTEEEVKALRLADNKLNESPWEMNLVIDELKGLEPELIDLTGFEQDLIIEPEDKDDEVPEVPDEPRSKLGDLYELGNHRVLAGDSTKQENVERLMDGKKADMVFTDPPYNVDYKGSGKKTSEGIMNDKMVDSQFAEFLLNSFSVLKNNIKISAGCYIFHSHKTAIEFEIALQKAGFNIDTQLIWNKPSAGMGMNDYRTKHEPFYYAYISKDEKIFYGDRRGTTVWKIPDDEQKALKWFRREQEMLEGGNTTVWTMKRTNVNEYVHPTQKPVELPAVAMMKSSKQEDIVIDPFLGSGTTLIAAEKTNRICYGMELDPKYIDVIVQRYCDYTGNNNIKLNGKEIIWNTQQKV